MATNLADAPELVTPGDLGAELASFVRAMRANNVSRNTITACGDAVRQFGRWLTAHDYPTSVAVIEPHHVEEWTGSILEVSEPATAHNRWRGLQRFFTWYATKVDDFRSPMRKLHPPRLPKLMPRALYERRIAYLEQDGHARLAEVEVARSALDPVSQRQFEAGASETGMTHAAYRRKLDVDAALREFPEPWKAVLSAGAGSILAAIVGVALVIIGQPIGAALLGTVAGVLGGVTVASVLVLGLANIIERLTRRSHVALDRGPAASLRWIMPGMATPGVAAEFEGARIVEFPLRGEWMAVHTPGSRIPSHGTDMLGQRYAFDLIRFDPERGGRYHPAGGPRTLLLGVPTRECHGWGEPVHAPLDGVVVAARDGLPERSRIYPVHELALVLWNGLTFRPTPQHLHRVMGNHVILECGDVYAGFAHLTTGSLAVEPGQPVQVGDVIGRVGHTGNSTAPHLHFQLMDGPDPLTAKGVPCAFREYEVWRDGGWRRLENAIPKSTDRIRSVPG